MVTNALDAYLFGEKVGTFIKQSPLPREKYEADGGPLAAQIASRIASVAGEEEAYEFVRQLAFNVAIAGTDFHSKNVSLIEGEHSVRLAPAYDVASYAQYVGIDDVERFSVLRSSMSIGGEWEFVRIHEPQWIRFARGAELDENTVLSIVEHIDDATPEAIAQAAQAFPQFASSSVITTLPDRVRAFRDVRHKH